MKSEEVIGIRKKLGLSRKQLAQLLEITYETLCRWENGKRSPSKHHEARLKRLSGKTEYPKFEEKWIFIASNIRHIKKVVSSSQEPMFGTVHALLDKNESLFLVRIRLRPKARALNDLKPYIWEQENPPRNQRKRIVGFFLASNIQIRPREHISTFMRDNIVFKAGYCVVYNKANDDITVWKPFNYLPVDIKKDYLDQIPYLVVG